MVAQVASMCAVSPVCPEHVHVILVPSSTTTGMTVHGGHLLSAQQPFDPLSVPSAHGPACIVRTARRSARRFIERVERGEKRRGARDEEACDSEGVDEFVVCTYSLIPLLSQTVGSPVFGARQPYLCKSFSCMGEPPE